MATKLKKQDIKELTTEELHQRIEDETVRYTKMKFNHVVSSLDNPHVLKNLRRDIARLNTEATTRKIEQSSNK